MVAIEGTHGKTYHKGYSEESSPDVKFMIPVKFEVIMLT